VALIGPARRRVRVLAGILLAAGLAAVVLGIWTTQTKGSERPAPFWAGVAASVPDPGPFGGRVGLYGATLPAGGSTPESLGCTSSAGGRRAPLLWSGDQHTEGDFALEHRVVAGVALVPLLEIEPVDGATLRCTRVGPAAPLYLVATTGVRDMVPMSSFSFASLALVVGGAGVLMLRREPS